MGIIVPVVALFVLHLVVGGTMMGLREAPLTTLLVWVFIGFIGFWIYFINVGWSSSYIIPSPIMPKPKETKEEKLARQERAKNAKEKIRERVINRVPPPPTPVVAAKHKSFRLTW